MMLDTAPSPGPDRPGVVIVVARRAGLIALFLVTILLGTMSGFLFAYSDDLPQISALDDFEPSTITRLLARDGQIVGEFATERRLVVGYDDISPFLRQAIIASEDAGFEQHFGLSISRIIVTAVRDVIYQQRAGASTITQQLARLLFLNEYMREGVYARTGRRGLERKIREAIVAVQIEKRYTKREILSFYANQINLGHGAYGVEAAARMYFGKSAKDVTLDEAAAIAAIIQTPARLSPFVNPTRTLARRNDYVLRRMVDEDFITQVVADAAAKRPIVLRGQPTPERSIAPYFAEEVRKALEQRYGADALYQAGLRVQTTLDVDLQRAANVALDRGLRRIDKRRSGYRRPARNLLKEGRDLERFTIDRWSQPLLGGDIVPAVVMSVPAAGTAGAARVRVGSQTLELPPSAYAWTRRTSPSDLFAAGDLIEVEVKEMRDGEPSVLALEQFPILEGALVALDNRTGQVRALVGGASYSRSQFNRATQARRQMGSVFKPVVYTAAIDRGFTPVSIFIDEPVSYQAGPGQPPYAPLNYDRMFEGPVTLRRALEQSRNIPAVKAMEQIGPSEVVAYAGRFGFTGSMPPYLSLALGAAEATLMEATSAYSAFPNQGVRMRPYLVMTVSDREGNVLEENRAEPHEAIRADTAFVMTNIMAGVVERGTAAAAAALDWPLAGKTGTVDNNTDAWFVGFDPDLSVGVWVGHDEKRTIGPNETGATAALPIWIDFMRAYIDARRDREESPRFEAPGNIAFVTLPSGATEAFINGTQPQVAAPPPPGPPAEVVPASSPVTDR